MFNFFSSVVDFFQMVWQFVINMVTGLLNATIIVSTATSLPIRLIGFVPSFISASITIVLAIGVVKLILGWGNS